MPGKDWRGLWSFPQERRNIAGMGGRPAVFALAASPVLVAAIAVGSYGLAAAGGSDPARVPSLPAPSQTADATESCLSNPDSSCGNDHARAIHEWVACKAENGKDACTKPLPPGRALGLSKHDGAAPGPASHNGHGHGWGRAHAPGHSKVKDRSD